MDNTNSNESSRRLASSRESPDRAHDACDRFLTAFSHARATSRDAIEQFFAKELDPFLDELEESLAEAPNNQCVLERAILSACDGEWDAAEKYLALAAALATHAELVALSPEEFFVRWVFWFNLNAAKDFAWSSIASAFGQQASVLAPVLWLQGLAELKNGQHEASLDCFERSLQADSRFWLSAKLIGDIFVGTRNWRAARGYYLQALQWANAPLDAADLHFRTASCNERLRDCDAAIDGYRKCLELDPQYKSAQNNIGWNLMRLRQYDEAEKVLWEAIERGIDGRTPLQNLAEVFRRTGRLSEAVALLQKDLIRGKASKYAEKLIAKIEQQMQGIGPEGQSEDAEDAEDAGGALMDDTDIGAVLPVSGAVTPSLAPNREQADQRTSASEEPRATHGRLRLHREDALEEQIEQQIRRDGTAFGRRLAVYESADKKYGRQFAIPTIGRIDILAVDLDTGDYVVIELKRDKSDDEVVGQSLRYVGWVRENLAKGNKVFGIICVGKTTERLRLAVGEIPGLSVFEFSLTLSPM